MKAIAGLVGWALLLALVALAAGLGISLAEADQSFRYGAALDELREERRWNAARAELIERLGRDLAEARGKVVP